MAPLQSSEDEQDLSSDDSDSDFFESINKPTKKGTKKKRKKSKKKNKKKQTSGKPKTLSILEKSRQNREKIIQEGMASGLYGVETVESDSEATTLSFGDRTDKNSDTNGSVATTRSTEEQRVDSATKDSVPEDGATDTPPNLPPDSRAKVAQRERQFSKFIKSSCKKIDETKQVLYENPIPIGPGRHSNDPTAENEADSPQPDEEADSFSVSGGDDAEVEKVENEDDESEDAESEDPESEDDESADSVYDPTMDIIFRAGDEKIETVAKISVYGEGYDLADDESEYHNPDFGVINPYSDREGTDDEYIDSGDESDDNKFYDDPVNNQELEDLVVPSSITGMKADEHLIQIVEEAKRKKEVKEAAKKKKKEENKSRVSGRNVEGLTLLEQARRGAKSSEEDEAALWDDNIADKTLAALEPYDGYEADSYEDSDVDSKSGLFKIALKKGKKRVVKPMPPKPNNQGKNRGKGEGKKPKRSAGELPKTASDQLDAEFRGKVLACRQPIEMCQQMGMPLVMQDEYANKKPDDSGDEDDARKKERRWPKVVVGMFLFTEQVPNENGGKGQTGNWKARPELHMYAGSQEAQRYLMDSINSTATRWGVHADFGDFAKVMFDKGELSNNFKGPRTTLPEAKAAKEKARREKTRKSTTVKKENSENETNPKKARSKKRGTIDTETKSDSARNKRVKTEQERDRQYGII